MMQFIKVYFTNWHTLLRPIIVASIICLILWIQSYCKPGAWNQSLNRGKDIILSVNGHAGWKHATLASELEYPNNYETRIYRFFGAVLILHFAQEATLFEFYISYWLVFSLLAVGFLLDTRYKYYSYVREQRIIRNQCIACGYDLRASTDNCPECGSTILKYVTNPSIKNIIHSAGQAARRYTFWSRPFRMALRLIFFVSLLVTCSSIILSVWSPCNYIIPVLFRGGLYRINVLNSQLLEISQPPTSIEISKQMGIYGTWNTLCRINLVTICETFIAVGVICFICLWKMHRIQSKLLTGTAPALSQPPESTEFRA
jgi:hypothetical protein